MIFKDTTKVNIPIRILRNFCQQKQVINGGDPRVGIELLPLNEILLYRVRPTEPLFRSDLANANERPMKWLIIIVVVWKIVAREQII